MFVHIGIGTTYNGGHLKCQADGSDESVQQRRVIFVLYIRLPRHPSVLFFLLFLFIVIVGGFRSVLSCPIFLVACCLVLFRLCVDKRGVVQRVRSVCVGRSQVVFGGI